MHSAVLSHINFRSALCSTAQCSAVASKSPRVKKSDLVLHSLYCILPSPPPSPPSPGDSHRTPCGLAPHAIDGDQAVWRVWHHQGPDCVLEAAMEPQQRRRRMQVCRVCQPYPRPTPQHPPKQAERRQRLWSVRDHTIKAGARGGGRGRRTSRRTAQGSAQRGPPRRTPHRHQGSWRPSSRCRE